MEIKMQDVYCAGCGSKFKVSEGTKQEFCSAQCKEGGRCAWKKSLLSAHVKLKEMQNAQSGKNNYVASGS